MDFYIYYKTGGYFSQIGRFWPCDNPSGGSFKGVATSFFNKIIADFKRDKECPIRSSVVRRLVHILYRITIFNTNYSFILSFI